MGSTDLRALWRARGLQPEPPSRVMRQEVAGGLELSARVRVQPGQVSDLEGLAVPLKALQHLDRHPAEHTPGKDDNDQRPPSIDGTPAGSRNAPTGFRPGLLDSMKSHRRPS